MSWAGEGWKRRGERARLAHEAVNEAFRARVRDSDPARYDELLWEFHRRTAEALPSSDPDFLKGLASGTSRAIETAIAFLEADPWFFRSGYEKQNLIRHLKRVPLTVAQKGRLAQVVLAAIDGRDRQEFRHFARLACAIWSDALDQAIALRMASTDPGIRRRATWVGEAAVSSGKA